MACRRDTHRGLQLLLHDLANRAGNFFGIKKKVGEAGRCAGTSSSVPSMLNYEWEGTRALKNMVSINTNCIRSAGLGHARSP